MMKTLICFNPVFIATTNQSDLQMLLQKLDWHSPPGQSIGIVSRSRYRISSKVSRAIFLNFSLLGGTNFPGIFELD